MRGNSRVLLAIWSGLILSASAVAADGNQGRAWVEAMKSNPMGPFKAVRWFCADGTILPPKPYACRPHGGGRQHGWRGEQAEALRADGILLGNVLAELTPETALADNAQLLKAVIVERRLARLDSGWIFRQARFTRGVFQGENDADAVRQVLERLAKTHARGADFLLLREAFRELDENREGRQVDQARVQAGLLADAEPAFSRLRNKIHSHLEPADANRVREYARTLRPEARKEFLDLAALIDEVFRTPPLADGLQRLARQTGKAAFNESAEQWRAATDAAGRLRAAAGALSQLRFWMEETTPVSRVAAMRLSLEIEQAVFVAAQELAQQVTNAAPHQRLAHLRALLDALYGVGMLSRREQRQAQGVIDALLVQPAVDVLVYRNALGVLARVPVWAGNRLHYHFSETLKAFLRVEPKVELILPDRMRGSPALSYGLVHESLIAEADEVAELRRVVFGKRVASDLRALNPGLGRGPLMALESLEGYTGPPPVVLAPESAADLPAVAGILTASEGNALSHVQLLARNLGVPNVVVPDALLPEIRSAIGRDVVLAASREGGVRLELDGPEWNEAFRQSDREPGRIEVDFKRLDLSKRKPLPMFSLRASDSGRSVGPKAAKLGELSARYPGQVAPGVAIPFGAFRTVLDSAHPSGKSLLEWMVEQYAALRKIPAGVERERETVRFLESVRAYIAAYEFDDGFRRDLERQMETTFGKDGGYGVFVRSDTNVEDLSGFTGAGLNLTVANVVGLENIIEAVRQVFASPFTMRAYGWRQALMDRPEHLYVAVLLQKTVPADKSGVMITAAIHDNDMSWVTLATNEGVSGGVEGQLAESLRVRLDGSSVELLASVAEPRKRVVLEKKGGVVSVPAGAPEFLLSPAEIEALLQVARSLPDKYPAIVDADGDPAPADVEFAIADGQLFLKQIRPFLQSDRARRSTYLRSLDAGLENARGKLIKLEAQP